MTLRQEARTPDLNSPESLAAKVWRASEPDVAAFIKDYEGRVRARGRLDENDIKEDLESAYQSEHAFVQTVCDQFELFAREAGGAKVVLFDIDETIIKMLFKRDSDEYDEIVRPSAKALIAALYEQYGVAFGFVSTRSQKGINNTLHALSKAGVNTSHFDKEYFLSTRDLSEEQKTLSEMPGPNGEIPEYMTFQFCKDILSQELRNKTTEELYTARILLRPGDRMKLILLQQTAEQHPDRSLFAVDDFLYPKFLCPPRAGGAYLQQEASFYIQE